MDFHVALERGALLFIMELPIPNHFWEHVKYWSENKEINNFHSEIETQAYKSSSYNSHVKIYEQQYLTVAACL